jgi:hypothetical protein
MVLPVYRVQRGVLYFLVISQYSRLQKHRYKAIILSVGFFSKQKKRLNGITTYKACPIKSGTDKFMQRFI